MIWLHGPFNPFRQSLSRTVWSGKMCSVVMRKKPLLQLHSLHDCCWNLSPFLPLRDSFIGLAKTLNATQILLTAWAHIFYPEPACDVHLCTHSRAKKWNLLFLRNAVDVKPHWTSPHTLLPVILARGPFLVYHDVTQDQKVSLSSSLIKQSRSEAMLLDMFEISNATLRMKSKQIISHPF